MANVTDATWTVLVPVRATADSKSRLQVGVEPLSRDLLARAMALDTVAAVAATTSVAHVIVVAADTPAWLTEAVESMTGRGAPISARVQSPGADLNQALVEVPTTGPVAAVLGDLPAMLPEDLDAVLAQAAHVCLGVVADAHDEGTCVLAAADGALAPSFGPGSLARHLDSGYISLNAHPRLRTDVDTLKDLQAATVLGLGPRTADLMSRTVMT